MGLKNKILLHSCCAICSAYPIALLRELGYEPIVYFCNPNIDTIEEFQTRLNTLKLLCNYYNAELLIDSYNHLEYLNYINGLENEPEKGKRCFKCIELRLIKTFKKAQEIQVEKFTTTLPISPHKNFAKISSIGENLSKDFLSIDFKKKDGFLKTNLISKELNLYRQNYCGCEFAKSHLKCIEDTEKVKK